MSNRKMINCPSGKLGDLFAFSATSAGKGQIDKPNRTRRFLISASLAAVAVGIAAGTASAGPAFDRKSALLTAEIIRHSDNLSNINKEESDEENGVNSNPYSGNKAEAIAQIHDRARNERKAEDERHEAADKEIEDEYEADQAAENEAARQQMDAENRATRANENAFGKNLRPKMQQNRPTLNPNDRINQIQNGVGALDAINRYGLNPLDVGFNVAGADTHFGTGIAGEQMNIAAGNLGILGGLQSRVQQGIYRIGGQATGYLNPGFSAPPPYESPPWSSSNYGSMPVTPYMPQPVEIPVYTPPAPDPAELARQKLEQARIAAELKANQESQDRAHTLARQLDMVSTPPDVQPKIWDGLLKGTITNEPEAPENPHVDTLQNSQDGFEDLLN